MIPRRIVDAFRRQDWFTVLVETMIVVLGVFLGLQVNNWNAAQADARAYDEALDRLRGEIDANMEMLDNAEKDIARELPIVRRASAALESCSDDNETRQAVNDGLEVITGTNGVVLRDAELSSLTSDPRLLAQQSPTIRRRLSDLRFAESLVAKTTHDFEYTPLESRVERIAGLRPGPRVPRQTAYLGVTINAERRSLQLSEPVSEACKISDLVAAFWLWDRNQTNLPVWTQKMRMEFKETLDVLTTEKS